MFLSTIHVCGCGCVCVVVFPHLLHCTAGERERVQDSVLFGAGLSWLNIELPIFLTQLFNFHQASTPRLKRVRLCNAIVLLR